MNSSRLLLVASITISFVVAAAAFRGGSSTLSTSVASRAGSLSPATPMLEPRSGHTRLCCPTARF